MSYRLDNSLKGIANFRLPLSASDIVANLESFSVETLIPLDSIETKASANLSGSAISSIWVKKESKIFLESNALYNLVKFSPPCSGSVKSNFSPAIFTVFNTPPNVEL